MLEEIITLEPGQLVRSRAGRDKGKHYLVLKIWDEKTVLLVNGKNRTLDKPKKKNIIHLQKYRRKVDDFTERLAAKEINDEKIAALIKNMVQEKEAAQREV